jgi:hypothetical protein
MAEPGELTPGVQRSQKANDIGAVSDGQEDVDTVRTSEFFTGVGSVEAGAVRVA